MKKLILLAALLFLSIASFESLANSKGSIYDFEIKSTNGEKLDLNQFKGKPLLIVNIATKCGYTGQLDELEKLNQKPGLNVLGIPSNDFASQTPENDQEVAKFCQLKYGVTFPITKKVVVVNDKKHPLIKHIVSLSGGNEIGWNFEKFLFDKNGNFVKRFGSSVTPDSKELVNEVDKVLYER